jgi:Fic family protein
MISSLPVPSIEPELALAAEDAVLELGRFDGEFGAVAAPFSAVLLRSESAASSEIEQLTASARSIGLAELGRASGPNSRSIVGNVRAMEAAIALADDLDTDAVLAMQAEILRDDHPEHTGAWRDQPVWIGGGFSHSPHTAAFVPPRHERVAGLMEDVMAFARRTDLPAMLGVAVAHAQFETIHPFPDGNGRTGRALIQAMLRRTGVTRNVTVPVSAGLLGDTGRYFDALTQYRCGDVEPIIRAVVDAAMSATANGRTLVADLTLARARWEDITSARVGSAGRRLLDVLQRSPVIDAARASAALGMTSRNVQNGIDRLVADGILAPIGDARRGRVYEAPEVLAALDAFAARAKRPRHR